MAMFDTLITTIQCHSARGIAGSFLFLLLQTFARKIQATGQFSLHLIHAVVHALLVLLHVDCVMLTAMCRISHMYMMNRVPEQPGIIVGFSMN